MKTMSSFLSKLFVLLILAFGLLNLPPVAMADNNGKAGDYRDRRGPTVADIIMNTEGLDTLEAALAANHLLEMFNERKRFGRQQFTVFAPTDEAFEDLFAALGIDETSDLSGLDLEPVLAYHVVSGKLSLTEVVTAGELKMLSGETTTTGVSNSGPFIEGASNSTKSLIVVAGLEALNGIVYVIDAVLLPPKFDSAEPPGEVIGPPFGLPGIPGTGEVCFTDSDCGGGEFCKKGPGICGNSDVSGVCASPALISCFVEEPNDPSNDVCGCDGNTYPSECIASGSGVNVDFAGPCPE